MSTMRNSHFIAGWIGAAMLANAVAVTAVTFFAAENLPSLFVVALIEAACLGAMQRSLIHRLSSGVRGWFFATLAGVVAGRMVQYALENGPWMPQIYRWPHPMQIAAGAGAGLAVGAVMALPQIPALNGHVRRTGVWVVTRALSTAASFVVLGLAQFMLGVPAVTFAEIFCLLLLIAGTAGAIGAAIEAPVMAWLLTSEGRGRVECTPVLNPDGNSPRQAGAAPAR
jgi:hypothetical protein